MCPLACTPSRPSQSGPGGLPLDPDHSHLDADAYAQRHGGNRQPDAVEMTYRIHPRMRGSWRSWGSPCRARRGMRPAGPRTPPRSTSRQTLHGMITVLPTCRFQPDESPSLMNHGRNAPQSVHSRLPGRSSWGESPQRGQYAMTKRTAPGRLAWAHRGGPRRFRGDPRVSGGGRPPDIHPTQIPLAHISQYRPA